jgi:hypothetical protein
VIGNNDDKDDADFDETEIDDLDESEDDDLDEDAMPDIGGETMIDVSGLFESDDADELIRVSGKADPDEIARRREVRKRLEEIAERRNRELDDTFNFNLDEEL